MKPQYLEAAVNSLFELPPSKIYVSILAGITLDSLQKVLQHAAIRVNCSSGPTHVVDVSSSVYVYRKICIDSTPLKAIKKIF